MRHQVADSLRDPVFSTLICSQAVFETSDMAGKQWNILRHRIFDNWSMASSVYSMTPFQ